ncbi:TetR/AcrR family transcriptional regulator [Streptomyces leeuwenhoekii]|uniref:TetR/AcrR family transcriptional regulator n=1 Tax=Streptomyces leeuwenhoekii TaxID=1437453 RepID=UPI0036768F27
MQKKSATAGRAQRTEESRRRILEATLELAAEKGYEGTAIAQVAKRSGLPVGSVYWHFENKDKLFAALLQHSLDEWEGRQDWLFRSEEPPSRQLEKMISGRTFEAAEATNFWRLGLLLALERRLSGSAAREMFLEIRRSRLDLISGWWQQALPPEVTSHDPGFPLRLAQFTMAAADGLYVSTSAGEDWDATALTGMLVDSIWHLVRQAALQAGVRYDPDLTEN